MKKRMQDWRKTIETLLILVSCCITLACGAGGGSGSVAGTGGGKGSLAVTVDWSSATRSASTPGFDVLAARMDCTGLSTVELQVYGPAPEHTLLASGGPWDCPSGHGVVDGIPAMAGCTVVLMVKNPAGQIIYHGLNEDLTIVAGQTTHAEIAASHFVPELTIPSGTSGQTAVNCHWNAVAAADSYDLRLSVEPDMSQYTATATQATTAIPSGIDAGVNYYCQIAAKDRFGNVGAGSNVVDFSVTLGSPELIAPAYGAVLSPGDISLSWQGPGGEHGCHLMVATDSQLDAALVDENLSAGTTSYLLSGLTDGQTYYWQVTALDAAGQPGPPSVTSSFTVITSTIELTSPQNEDIRFKDSIRLHWEPVVPAAGGYRVTISREDDPDNWIDRSITGNATYYDPIGLQSGTAYLWQISAINGEGQVTHISPRWKFTTLRAPDLQSPQMNAKVANGLVAFQWANGISGPNYRILVSEAQDFSSLVLDDLAASVPYETESLQDGRTYYFKVRPVDSNGIDFAGCESVAYRFQTLSKASPIGPGGSGMVSTTDISFSWNAHPDASALRLVVSANPDPTIAPIIDTQVNGQNYFVPDPDELDCCATYYWRLYLIDEGGNQGSASDVFTFVTDPTVLVKDIRNGSTSAITENAQPAVFDNQLFFPADDGSHGVELWMSDGTRSGTTMVRDIHPTSNGYPRWLSALGASLLFSANDGVYGTELWKYDAVNGAHLMMDLLPGSESSNVSGQAVGDQFFFGVDEADGARYVWRSDGTVANTTKMMSDQGAPFGYIYAGMGIFGGDVYFPGISNAVKGLWRIPIANGIAAKVAGEEDGISGFSVGMDRVATCDGSIFFSGYNEAVSGYDLFRYDPATGQTHLISLNPGGYSYPVLMGCIDDALYVYTSGNTAPEGMWRVDSVSYNSVLTDTGGARLFPEYQGFKYFYAVKNQSYYKTDGTQTNTQRLDALSALIGRPLFAVAFNDKVYMVASQADSGQELWVTDFTAAGTHLVKDINPGAGDSDPADLKVVGDTLFFTAEDGIHGRELWKTVACPYVSQ